MFGLKIIDDEVGGQFCLLAIRYLIGPSFVLVFNKGMWDVVLKHIAKIVGKFIR